MTGYISCKEAGELLNLTPEYVRRLCRIGRMKGARLEGLFRKDWAIPDPPIILDRKSVGRPAEKK